MGGRFGLKFHPGALFCHALYEFVVFK
jgi:hypothetical protein